jgi:hypothetical protein
VFQIRIRNNMGSPGSGSALTINTDPDPDAKNLIKTEHFLTLILIPKFSKNAFCAYVTVPTECFRNYKILRDKSLLKKGKKKCNFLLPT